MVPPSKLHTVLFLSIYLSGSFTTCFSYQPFLPNLARMNKYTTILSKRITPLLSKSNVELVMDDFDPLISPHNYPNGVDGGKSVQSTQENNSRIPRPTLSTTSSTATTQSQEEIDDFDPRISPHKYSNGILSIKEVDLNTNDPSNKKQEKVGILLIDHGSRREESNQHLELIASEYQKKLGAHFEVRAAHMEIVKPDIQDGIQTLLDLNVGKHAVKDVPNLIAVASESIANKNNVPIVTTDPLGLHVDLMVDAIDTAVQGHALLNGGVGKEKEKKKVASLGGFFGDIQKQIEDSTI